jgi:hypothetical protein
VDLGICGKELSQVNICLNVGHVPGTESRTRSLDSIVIYFGYLSCLSELWFYGVFWWFGLAYSSIENV